MVNNKKFEIDMTPDWEGVYRYLMHIKKWDIDQYNRLLKTGEGEWEKLLNMANAEGWNN